MTPTPPSPFEIWIYRGLIGALFVVVWYFVRRDASAIRKDVREVVDELKKLTTLFTRHDEKIDTLSKRVDKLEDKVDQHITNN